VPSRSEAVSEGMMRRDRFSVKSVSTAASYPNQNLETFTEPDLTEFQFQMILLQQDAKEETGCLSPAKN